MKVRTLFLGAALVVVQAGSSWAGSHAEGGLSADKVRMNTHMAALNKLHEEHAKHSASLSDRHRDLLAAHEKLNQRLSQLGAQSDTEAAGALAELMLEIESNPQFSSFELQLMTNVLTAIGTESSSYKKVVEDLIQTAIANNPGLKDAIAEGKNLTPEQQQALEAAVTSKAKTVAQNPVVKDKIEAALNSPQAAAILAKAEEVYGTLTPEEKQQLSGALSKIKR